MVCFVCFEENVIFELNGLSNSFVSWIIIIDIKC